LSPAPLKQRCSSPATIVRQRSNVSDRAALRGSPDSSPDTRAAHRHQRASKIGIMATDVKLASSMITRAQSDSGSGATPLNGPSFARAPSAGHSDRGDLMTTGTSASSVHNLSASPVRAPGPSRRTMHRSQSNDGFAQSNDGLAKPSKWGVVRDTVRRECHCKQSESESQGRISSKPSKGARGSGESRTRTPPPRSSSVRAQSIESRSSGQTRRRTEPITRVSSGSAGGLNRTQFSDTGVASKSSNWGVVRNTVRGDRAQSVAESLGSSSQNFTWPKSVAAVESSFHGRPETAAALPGRTRSIQSSETPTGPGRQLEPRASAHVKLVTNRESENRFERTRSTPSDPRLPQPVSRPVPSGSTAKDLSSEGTAGKNSHEHKRPSNEIERDSRPQTVESSPQTIAGSSAKMGETVTMYRKRMRKSSSQSVTESQAKEIQRAKSSGGENS